MTTPVAPYDPAKAHAYYIRTRQLKGRTRAAAVLTKNPTVAKAPVAKLQKNSLARQKAAKAKIARLTIALNTLNDALHKAQVALRNKQAEAKKNSDGKSTVKEKQAAKQFRDTHKAQIAAADKKASKATPAKAAAPKSVSDMNEKELTARISKIKVLISNVHGQIKAAQLVLKS